MTPAEIKKLLAEWEATDWSNEPRGLKRWEAAPDLARLALDQARELAVKDAEIEKWQSLCIGPLSAAAIIAQKDALIAELCAHIRSLLMICDGVPMTGIYAGQIADKDRAANEKLALHESENVTRGLLIDKLEAQLKTVQSSLINAQDQANAMVGAALREAAEAIGQHALQSDVITIQALKETILALAPDATVALDRALERMRERCAEVASKACHAHAVATYQNDEGRMQNAAKTYAADAIRITISALPLHEEPNNDAR